MNESRKPETWTLTNGHQVRVVDGRPEWIGRGKSASWKRVSMQQLRRKVKDDGEFWAWLGVKRPGPSGPSGRTLTEEERGTAAKVRLSKDSCKHVDELARRWRCPRREAVERAIERAWQQQTRREAVERAIERARQQQTKSIHVADGEVRHECPRCLEPKFSDERGRCEGCGYSMPG